MKTIQCYIASFLAVHFVTAQQQDEQSLRRLRSEDVNRATLRKNQDQSNVEMASLSFERNLWAERSTTMSLPYVPKTNVILEWNDVSMKAVIADYTNPKVPSCSLAPPANALQIAKTHLAMYDALGSVLDNGREPYLLYADTSTYGDVSYESAVATAAHLMLRNSFPSQNSSLNEAYEITMERLKGYTSDMAIMNGQMVGETIVDAYIANRTNDQSCPINMTYVWRNESGQHQPDPFHPNQGIVAPNYGDVALFVKKSSEIDLAPPPKLSSEDYVFVFDQVKRLGGDNITTPAERTWQESVAAWYYAFDGAPYLGSPVALMNLVVREILGKVLSKKSRMLSEQKDPAVMASYVLAQMHAAMADAGILTWKQKYQYNFWRPISGIRSAESDGNNMTTPDLKWTYLGAPRSNPLSEGQKNFDPAFPSHSSGHASFCSAAMKSLGNILQTNDVEYEFTSWEWNGTTTDELGIARPYLYQKFDTLSEFAALCGASRVWGGVHWCTDCQSGHRVGDLAADSVYENSMRWKNESGKKNVPAITLKIATEDEVLLYLDRKKKLNYFVEGKSEEEVKRLVEEYFLQREKEIKSQPKEANLAIASNVDEDVHGFYY